MPSAGRLKFVFNTVRYLKVSQIVWRLHYQLRKSRVRKVALKSIGQVSFNYLQRPFTSPVYAQPSFDGGKTFRFLGKEGELISSESWNDHEHEKLWLYNLHYFDDLNAVDAVQRLLAHKELINRWIRENPPLVGNGWEPYPLSLRLVNLLKWLAGPVWREAKADIPELWKQSLGRQAQALLAQQEHHILGNHIFANGKALVFAGVFLEAEGSNWLKAGLAILDQQLPEQFLPDGAHFELSPMYHSILMWDMCDLINLAEIAEIPALKERLDEWQTVLERGMEWLRSMLHPDGGIPFFNDASFGIAPTYDQLRAYASLLPGVQLGSESKKSDFSATLLKESGYISVELGPGAKALLDIAKVGPDYQPGHAHADTLSFELSLFGQRIFVNSGTSQYGEGPERQRQRSTAAHNTVEVDGQNSSEVWAGFRVARRAYPKLEEFTVASHQIRIQASHTGYQRLKGRNIHRREWSFSNNHLAVTDKILGGYGRAVSRLHVHPKVKFESCEGGFRAKLDGGEVIWVQIAGADDVRIVPSSWHPEFGVSVPTQCIEAVFAGGQLVTTIFWGEAQ